ncbi:MAG: universal stress protein [Deinococcales bacterium]
MMINNNHYQQSVQDFYQARRQATLEELFAKLRGQSSHLFSYDEVKEKLHAIESADRRLKEISLAAIVGSVGRYHDFTRSFLPKQNNDVGRWANVKAKILGLEGTPPIEVYQLGEVYFVRDGNHRVSVAKQLGAKAIEAYVTKVYSPVPLSPGFEADDLILKAEYADFLSQTDLANLRPESLIEVTAPGHYSDLLNHIDLHRYYMGLKLRRDISYQEAVVDWYDHIYLPATSLIRESKLLEDFPGRTEADLYLWLAEKHSDLEKSLGWTLSSSSVVKGLSKKTSKPNPEMTPLFKSIMVALSGDEVGWQALEQALIFAEPQAKIYGIHALAQESDSRLSIPKMIAARFEERCAKAGIQAQMSFSVGPIASVIAERSPWMDLLIAPLSHPPQHPSLFKTQGYEKLIRASYCPVLSVPSTLSHAHKISVAFDGSETSMTALAVAAYMAKHWQSQLSVIHVVTAEGIYGQREVLGKAESFLEEKELVASIIKMRGEVAPSLLEASQEQESDLMLCGSYTYTPFFEAVLGGVLNQLLKASPIPLLICNSIKKPLGAG